MKPHVSLALGALCVGVSWGAGTLPEDIAIQTPYGQLILVLTDGIRNGSIQPGSPCVSLFSSLDNTTGVGWSSLELSVKVSGDGLSLDVPVRIPAISGDSMSADSIVAVGVSCNYYGWPSRPDRMIGRLVGGTPDSDDVAAFNRRRKAKETAAARASAQAKLVSDISAAHSAAISKLPLLKSGSPMAFVGSDRKCAEQFQQALSMDGLEKRKRIADLVLYGCGFLVDTPVHVRLSTTDRGFVLVTIADGKFEGKLGWAPAAWVAK